MANLLSRNWSERRRDWALAVGLILAVVAAYWPALTGGFLLDDDLHVTRGELRSLAGLWRIWSEPGATQQYYPVLHTAFWVEHRMWGDAVLGYHLVNIGLHAVAALLAVALVRELRLAGAWLAGFLFALHPVAVESVAWIAEQKNTLSTVFCLGAVLVYLRFDRERRGGRYAVAAGLFGLALLSKTATATLPAVLLVIAWWQRGRLEWKHDVRPLVPWFVAAGSIALVTVRVERQLIAGIGANLSLTWIERALIASRGAAVYLWRVVWPTELAFFYERLEVSRAGGLARLYVVMMLAGLAALVVLARRTRGPLAAGLIFVGTLFPVLGFINVEWFVFSFVADHFQYLANLAVIIAAAVGLSRWRWTLRVAPVLLLALGVLTWRHSATFRSSEALYANAVARSPKSAVAHNHYGVALAKDAVRLDEAIAEFEAALRINPDAAEVHENLGDALRRVPGRAADGLAHFETAFRLKPQLASVRRKLAAAHFDRGKALAEDPSKTAEAAEAYAEALRFDPDFVEAHYNLGNALMRLPGNADLAAKQFEAALRLKPEFAEAHTNLGTLLARAGRLTEAIAHFEAAVRADPNFVPARNNLERARVLLGRSGNASP